MTNQYKAFSIISYIIWPFSAVLIGLKNFDSAFGRKLLVAAFAFLGYVADDNGDLEYYASMYYEASDSGLNHLFDQLFTLQSGKFFTDFTALIFSIFDNHHIYFAFLFGLFGYFLINVINFFRININLKSQIPILIGFIAFALFYSILTIYNYAFYMGGIYFLYFLIRLIFSENKKKYYIFILLTPLFHIGLVPVLLIPIFYSIFKQRTKLYLILLISSYILSQSFLIEKLESYIVGSDTVIESKFRSYASDSGRERLETRYEQGYMAGNFNYKISRSARYWANNIGIPVLLLFLFANRKTIKEDKDGLDLFNLGLACLSITNLMLNVSQGERFYFFSGFMILATYSYCVQKKNYNSLKYRFLLFISLPLVLLSNLVNLIIAKNYMSLGFLFSNFLLKLFELI